MAKNSKTYELMLKIGAKTDSSLKKACIDADKNLAKLGKSVKAAGKLVAAGSVAIASAAAAVTVASVKAAMDYQAQLANVSTLLSGTEAEIAARTEEIGKDILRVSNATGVETANLTDGMYQVISAFGDSADSISILETAAKAAAAGNATTTDSVNLLSAVMKGYNDVSAESAQRVADLSFATVRLGQTSFSELASSIGKVVPLSSALGIQQEELYGVFATLTGVTGSTAEVATQYKAVLSGLMTPSKNMTASLKKLGYATADAAIEDLGFQGTLEALKKIVNGDEQALAKLFSSTEAQTAVLAMCGAQAENLTSKTAEMYAATGAANDAFERQTDTLAYDIQMIKNLGKNFLTELGTNILPYVKDLAEAALPMVQTGLQDIGGYLTGTVIPAAQSAAQWVGEHKTLLLALAAGITASVVAYKVATTAMTAYNAAMAIYKVVCAASATGTFTLAGAVAALNLPLIAIVAIIGLVVAAGILLYKNWDLVKEKAAEFGAGVVSVFKGMANGAIGFINGIIGGVNRMITAINSISLTVPEWVPFVGGEKIGFDLQTIPTIPALAQGGIAVAPTTALIGEGAEPEAVLPLSKLADMIRQYIPVQQGGNGFTAGGNGEQIIYSPVFHFSGGGSAQEVKQAAKMSFEEFKRLYRQLKEEERRKGFSPE
ncbi:MAG: phage tail tape measure protein [Faecalibacterium sp.]